MGGRRHRGELGLGAVTGVFPAVTGDFAAVTSSSPAVTGCLPGYNRGLPCRRERSGPRRAGQPQEGVQAASQAAGRPATAVGGARGAGAVRAADGDAGGAGQVAGPGRPAGYQGGRALRR